MPGDLELYEKKTSVSEPLWSGENSNQEHRHPAGTPIYRVERLQKLSYPVGLSAPRNTAVIYVKGQHLGCQGFSKTLGRRQNDPSD